MIDSNLIGMRQLYEAALKSGRKSTEGRTFEEWCESLLDFGVDDARDAFFSHQTGNNEPSTETFQDRVQPWLVACFGPQTATNKIERNHRFLEEALELVQACGCTQSEAHQLVDYTFGRAIGDPSQETGGVMLTLAALCLAQGFDMHHAAETELVRVWTKIKTIRAKQARKPKHSPLPVEQTQEP